LVGFETGNGRSATVDYAEARQRMVAEQLMRRGIKDPHILKAMGKVPRHLFVDAALRHRAYDDFPLPIGEEQTISQPYIVAIMTEALDLQGHERVLEIGTGSGYQTAILAELARKVYSIERIEHLAEAASKRLQQLGYSNVLIKVGDGSLGWKEEAPFDAILTTAGAPQVPQALLEQLADKGRLVIPVGDVYSQVLKKVVREGEAFHSTDLLKCVFVKLLGEQGWKE